MEDYELLSSVLTPFTTKGSWGTKQILVYRITVEIVWEVMCLPAFKYNGEPHDKCAE